MLYKDEKKALARVSALFKEGKFAEIKEGKERRSIPQNDLYWFWLTFLERESETGNTKDDFHEYFKWNFLGFRTNTFNFNDDSCQLYTTVITTTKLNTKEFSEYMEKIERFANMEFNINLPHPEDLGFAELYEKYGN